MARGEEGTLLHHYHDNGRKPLLLKIFIGFLVVAVIGLTVGMIILGTRKTPHDNTPVEYENCPYYDQLLTLTAQTQGMYKENRARTLQFFTDFEDNGVIFLLGNVDILRNGDVTYLFRQESNVLYLTGYDQPEAYVVIDPISTNATLFVPQRDERYAVWNGVVMTNDQIRQKYDVDQVLYLSQLGEYLNSISTATVYTLKGMEEPLGNFTVDNSYLNSALTAARRVKSDKELLVLKLVNQISSNAHNYAMKKAATKLRNNEPLWEYDLESFFLYLSYNCRARFQSYTTIVGSGPNSAILHYIANDRQVQNSDFILIDAGAELWGYGADITRTFPAAGKFSDEQKQLYEMVLRTQQQAVNILKEGVTWEQLNNITRVSVTNELLQAGFIQGTFEELWANNIYSYFFPHGVGHSLGLDVHDSDFARNAPILSGAFLTVEPGIYFNQVLLETGFNNINITKYFNQDKITPFFAIGGVRIEDDYIVTTTGSEHVTQVTSDVTGIESLMAEDVWA